MPDGTEPLRISWSRVRSHQECTMHTALLRAGKRATSADIRGFFPGTVMDRAERWFLDQPEPKRGMMVERIAQILDEEERSAKETGDGIVRWKHPGDKREVLARLAAGAARLEVILLRNVVPYDYDTAVRFQVPLTLPYLDGTPTKVLLIGEMDLLLRPEPGLYKVYDLKFTQDTSYWRKVIGQLTFYEVAVFLGWGAWPRESGLIIPELDPPVLFWQRPAELDELRREVLVKIAKYAEDVWSGKAVVAATTKPCYWCDTKHACPRYSAPRAGGGRIVMGGT